MPVFRRKIDRFLLGAVAAALLLAPIADRPAPRGSSIPGSPPRENCRLWAITGPAPGGLIDDHLRSGAHSNFKILSLHDRDGWGIVSFPTVNEASALVLPLARRGGVYAANPYDPDFDLAVSELASLEPSAAVVHVRTVSSAHFGVPDPHPFVHEGFAFAHNGAINVAVLIELLTADEPDYLQTHPPAYTGDYIDSELYFLWLLKYRHQHPTLSTLDALQQAVSILFARVSPQKLNFALTRGDTLWACRCAGNDALDPLRLHPATGGGASPYWVVCSTVVGSDSLDWSTFPPLSIACFVPGQAPLFEAISSPGGAPDSERGDGDPVSPSDRCPDWLGRPEPNPSNGSVRIPLRAPDSSRPIEVEIWSPSGRLVWKAQRPAGRGPGTDLEWSGIDAEGRRVAPGVYFCRARLGSESAERKITVLR